MLNGCRARGTTLVELLAVLVVLALVSAAIMRTTVSQQRFLDAIVRIIEMRRTAREGVDIPRQDLRAISPGSGGIYAMSAEMVDFRSTLGASVACRIDGSRTSVSVPDRGAWSALTSWVASPRQGDTVLVFDQALDGEPPLWRVHTLAADPSPGGVCPVSGGFARTTADEAAALELRMAPPLEPTIRAGAALRFVRRARYQLYRASDGQWYLGYLDCLASRSEPCSTIQPVSGPFATTGIRFLFRDASGTETSDPASVSRIDILSRATTTVALRAMGFAGGVHTDSVVASIALRNR